MKNNRSLMIILIVILAIIALSIIGFMTAYIAGAKTNIFSFSTQNEVIFEKNYLNSEIQDISIDAISSDIKIKTNDVDEIKVVVHGKKDDEIKINASQNQLKIEQDLKSVFCIGICYQTRDIVIYVPTEYEKNITINTKSSDIYIEDFYLINFNINTKSGDIDIFEANDLKLNTISGDVNIQKAEYGKVKTTSGDIDIEQIKNIELKTTSGDIEIGTLLMNKNGKINTVSGDVEIDQINDIYIETSTMSGDIKVRKNNRFSKYELMIKTTSGDIKIRR